MNQICRSSVDREILGNYPIKTRKGNMWYIHL